MDYKFVLWLVRCIIGKIGFTLLSETPLASRGSVFEKSEWGAGKIALNHPKT